VGSKGHVDYLLVGAVLVLLAIGAQMVYSSSVVIAHNEFGDDTYFLTRQMVWAGIGLAGLVLAAGIDYHRWEKISFLLLFVSTIALVLVLMPQFGTTRYGSARWLQIGSLPLVQPSEFTKLAVVVYFADWLSRKGYRVGELFHGSIPFILLLSLIAGLVLAEPDLGTTVIICAAAFSIFFVAGANLSHLILFLPLGLAATWVAINTVAYRADRLAAFLDPWADPQAKGWQTIQTLIALGSGGLTGVGFGMSRQKAYALPNAHTDSIFAIIGEELGLIGTLAVVLLFLIVGWRGIRIAMRAPDGLGRLLAIGLTSMIIWQAIVNVGAVTNSLPYTGVTLPFVSFGGSSLCVSLVAVGILLSVSRLAGSGAWVEHERASPGEPPGKQGTPSGQPPSTRRTRPSRRRARARVGAAAVGGGVRA